MSAFTPDDESWIDALAHAEDADPDQDHLQDLLALTDSREARVQLEGLIEARDALRRAAMQDEVLAEAAAQPNASPDRDRVRHWAEGAGLAALVATGESSDASKTVSSEDVRRRSSRFSGPRLARVAYLAAAAAVLVLLVRPLFRGTDTDGGTPADAVLGGSEGNPLEYAQDPAGRVVFRWDLELPAGGYVELSFYEEADDGSRGVLLFGPRRMRGASAWTAPSEFPVFGAARWQWELVAYNGLNLREGTYRLSGRLADIPGVDASAD